jgi:organic hydroperoxide reductase OsmC/OhrA
MTSTPRPKEIVFGVEVVWDAGRRTTAAVHGKAPLPIAPPPEFRGTDPGVWSPEDAFVAAAGSCLAVTIAGLAQRAGLPMHGLSVDARGVVGRRSDGRFGFTRIEQTVRLETDDDQADRARSLVAEADESCLVSASLALPVQTTIDIRARAATAAG